LRFGDPFDAAERLAQGEFEAKSGDEGTEIGGIGGIGERTIARRITLWDFKIAKGEYCRALKIGREP